MGQHESTPVTRIVARCPANPGRSARPVRVGATRLTYPCPDRATILVCGSRSERNRLRHEACSRRTSENLQTSARQVFLQLLSVPVVTRFMVDRPTFPIMPISRLDERPDRTATIQDITCDSDGKINNFISSHGANSHLAVHALNNKEPYYIGVFLVGAYQEILGDMHNLFGDTNAVHVSVYKDRYEIDQVIDGETVAEVLDYVQFSPKKLVRSVETWVTSSMKAGIITPEEGREFLSNYRSGLYGYTYLEND